MTGCLTGNSDAVSETGKEVCVVGGGGVKFRYRHQRGGGICVCYYGNMTVNYDDSMKRQGRDGLLVQRPPHSRGEHEIVCVRVNEKKEQKTHSCSY